VVLGLLFALPTMAVLGWLLPLSISRWITPFAITVIMMVTAGFVIGRAEVG
jgi:hypothetical protein